MNLLDLAYVVLAGLAAPFWMRKTRGDWPARFGKGEALPPPTRPRVLLHAVSVGEVSALRTLVPLLAERAEVVISVGTDTGIARARDLFSGSCHIVRYPIDFSWAVKRFLNRVRPDVVGLVELEVWPNFTRDCVRRSIPVAVINGRLSARSFKGYRRLRFFFGRVFRRLAAAAVQDEAYAARFRAMGVVGGRVQVTGTMKWDAATIQDDVPGAQELAKALGIDPSHPLIVAGSTAEGEEELLHWACPTGAQLLCAPRKPERFVEAASALPECARRSQQRAAPLSTTRFLLDTIGELRKAYALADIVVIGRSFGSLHGSDPIEPVALGKATVIGPAYGDFLVSVGALKDAGAILETTRERLSDDLQALLADPGKRKQMAEAGRQCIRRHQGASARHADLLLGLVRSSAAASGDPAIAPSAPPAQHAHEEAP